MEDEEARRELLPPPQHNDDTNSADSDAESSSAADVNDWSGQTLSKNDDLDVLREADERERLLETSKESSSRIRGFKPVLGTNADGQNKSRTTKSRRRTASGHSHDESQIMFEMEEGFQDTSSQSSFEHNDRDEKRWNVEGNKSSKPRRYLVYLTIIVLCSAFALGAFEISQGSRSKITPLSTLSNGTHTFAPTTILISLDGFRADFLQRGLTPALNAFRASGVSPHYMLPSFPSVTFPNHFTLVTGLYPQDHGIVGNQFWDEVFQEEFYYTNTVISMQPKWWTNGEPIWSVAERQGVRTAVHMWPGSEAHIPEVDPTYIDKFNGSEALPRKVDRILGWLDLPGDHDDLQSEERRPQLIAAYVPNVDSDGHKFGPNSTEIRATIADVDSMFIMLVEGLLARNLTEIVNIVVVSDHGMATTSNERLIQLDDLIDLSLVDHIDGWPLRGLRLTNPDRDIPILEQQLLKAAKKAGSFDVYTPATMPERYHFSSNDRIAPLWVVPKAGWAVVEKHDFDVEQAKATGEVYRPKGLHGYDHEHPLMRAIFIARGPAFPHLPNSRIPNFQNTEVYNIICDSLGVNPNPSNGTLRLPFSTIGLHSDVPSLDPPSDIADDDKTYGLENLEVVDASGKDTQTDDPSSTVQSTSMPDLPTESDTPGKATATDIRPPSTQLLEVPTPTPSLEVKPEDPKSSWWSFIHEQLEKAKDWAKEFIDSIKGNKPPNG